MLKCAVMVIVIAAAAAKVGATGWQSDDVTTAEFPKEPAVTVFQSAETIAGYPAMVHYYFLKGKFFQATVRFDFDNLAAGDININVFKSVNEYYSAIRTRTITFVDDCLSLLKKRYGTPKPYFKNLDPARCFSALDAYFNRDAWNLRFHPDDYYHCIMTQAYARWEFPKTPAIFSIIISAPDQRFDYTLSVASAELAQQANAAKDSLSTRGL